MSEKPISTSKLVPVMFACSVVAVLAMFGAPEIILIPIAAITVAWIAVMVLRHYMSKKEDI